MTVLLSRDDAWKLDTSMFVVDGSWETGYVYDKQIFTLVGVWDVCKIGESWAQTTFGKGEFEVGGYIIYND